MGSTVNLRWLVGRLLGALLTLAFVIVFNFFLFRGVGDPTTQLARLPRATPQEIKKLKAAYGLDKPIFPGQFVDYVGDTLRLDLGTGQKSRESVSALIWQALPWTLLLAGTGTIIATLVGTWMGIKGATNRGKKIDDGFLSVSLFTYAAPEYWLGILLILVFAVALPILPAGQQVTPGEEFSSWIAYALNVLDHLILPATTFALALLGQYYLIMRSSMVEVLTEDFVTVKRATGLPWKRVVSKHAVPNALLPLVTLSALQFGFVVGGAITIETIFSWPGLGLLSYEAINDKDFPVLEGTFIVFSAAVIVANLLADVLYFFLDPRVQHG